jgi:hypothetical protein
MPTFSPVMNTTTRTARAGIILPQHLPLVGRSMSFRREGMGAGSLEGKRKLMGNGLHAEARQL